MDLNEIVAWQYVNLGGQVYYLREDVFPFLVRAEGEMKRKLGEEAALREKMSGQKILAEEAFNNLEKYYRLRTKEDASTIDGLRAKVLEQGNLIGSLQTELKRVKKEGDEQLDLARKKIADLKFDLGRMQEEKDFLSSTTNERSREKTKMLVEQHLRKMWDRYGGDTKNLETLLHKEQMLALQLEKASVSQTPKLFAAHQLACQDYGDTLEWDEEAKKEFLRWNKEKAPPKGRLEGEWLGWMGDTDHD